LPDLVSYISSNHLRAEAVSQ